MRTLWWGFCIWKECLRLEFASWIARMQTPPDPLNPSERDFDSMIESWLSLTYVLNNLSRGLGLPDSYPFVLSLPAIGKLRFIHDTIDQRALGDVSGWSVARPPAAASG